MMPNRKCIDKILPLLQGVKPSGDSERQWVACCPAHNDSQQSLAIGMAGDGRLLVKCYAGCATESVMASVGLTMSDLFPNGKVSKPRNGVTVAGLAFDKRIPVEFLATLGLRDEGSPGKWSVKIPYLGLQGEKLFERTRTAAKAKDGSYQPKGQKLQPYGLWRLAEYRTAGDLVVVVEGESDCWACWLHGFPVLGVPGASAAKSLQPEFFTGFSRVIVWQEPDAGGVEFASTVINRVQSFGLNAHAVSADGVKDPCVLRIRNPDGFKEEFTAILASKPATMPDFKAAAVTAEGQAGGRPCTDLGNAQRLIDKYGDDIRYLSAAGRWYVWDGKRYRDDERNQVQELVKNTIRSIYTEAASTQDPALRVQLGQHAHRSESARSILTIPKLAISDPRVCVGVEEWDRDPWLLNCENGTVDLKTGDFREHKRSDLLTKLAPVVYDPAAKCPVWEATLAAIFPADVERPEAGGNRELIEYVQRLFGCVATGFSVPTFPIFHGGGANGKTTILNAIMDVLGTDYCMQAPNNFLMEKRSDSHPTETADLYGKRLVSVSETPSGRKIDAGLVKAVTGGEPIRSRRMRMDMFEFKPTHMVILCTNHKPKTPDTDDGIWRRIALVPFLARFWNPDRGDSGPEMYRQDRFLGEKLKAERAGILNWLIQGAMSWAKIGLAEPTEVKLQTEEYRSEENSIGQFVNEKLRREKKTIRTPLLELYKCYKQWTEDNGEYPRSNKAFANELRALGFETVRGEQNGARTVIGVAITGNVRSLDDLPD